MQKKTDTKAVDLAGKLARQGLIASAKTLVKRNPGPLAVIEICRTRSGVARAHDH